MRATALRLLQEQAQIEEEHGFGGAARRQDDDDDEDDDDDDDDDDAAHELIREVAEAEAEAEQAALEREEEVGTEQAAPP